MNANELADIVDHWAWSEGEEYLTDAANMLRQQQEQIDKLTAIVALRELKIEHMVEKQSHYEAIAHAGGVEVGKELKTLTDEEIMSEWEESKDEVDFARAILRKAQEK
jgi:hypothetical protein